MLLDAKGNAITDHAKFLEVAAEVLGVFLELPTVTPNDVPLKAFLPLSEPILRDYELERDFKPKLRPDDEPRSGIVLDCYRLCGEHARQLARGALAALHYARCFPAAAAPTPSLLWAAGSISFIEEPECLPSIVALLRAAALGVADEELVNGAFRGVHERGRKVVLRPVDEAEANEISVAILLLWLDINAERGPAKDTRPYGLTERYREDEPRFLATVVEFYRQWADFGRLPKVDRPRPMTNGWFRLGF